MRNEYVGGGRARMVGAFIAAVLAVWLAAGAVYGGIVYNEQYNALWVTDFPGEFPCDMQRLTAVDRMHEWGKVAYDKATDTYTVSCDLMIGTNDGTETYFRIGSKEHPKETVVMKGHVGVAPYWIKGENEGEYYRVPTLVNRLTLGDAKDKSVTAALKFDCETRGQYGLMIGGFLPAWEKKAQQHGGQLHVYNSTITAARQDRDHALGLPTRGNILLSGDDIVLENATISWVAGFVGYGLASGLGRTRRIVDTVFENSGVGLVNGKNEVVGCTFRNMGDAVIDWGSIDATLIDCTLEGNDRNVTLRYTKKGVVCIDCNIGAPKKGDVFDPRTTASLKTKNYGEFVSRRHVVVEVVDGNGKPIPGAEVNVKCEQGVPETVENWKHAVNAAGKTPAKGEKDSILLTEVVKKCTDTPNEPKVTEYSYAVAASAAGYADNTANGVKPVESWKVIRVVLEKK